MATKLVECEHCDGEGTCSGSGGRSCQVCLEAAGMGRQAWNTVRCSFCGGMGKVWVEEDEDEEEAEEEKGEQESEEAGADDDSAAEAEDEGDDDDESGAD